MKVLYISPAGASGPMMALLARCGYEVTCVAKPSEALDMIDDGYFGAVLIAEEIEDSDALGFISKVHRKQPELLVFQLSVWRSDLGEDIGTSRNDRERHRHTSSMRA